MQSHKLNSAFSISSKKGDFSQAESSLNELAGPNSLRVQKYYTEGQADKIELESKIPKSAMLSKEASNRNFSSNSTAFKRYNTGSLSSLKGQASVTTNEESNQSKAEKSRATISESTAPFIQNFADFFMSFRHPNTTKKQPFGEEEMKRFSNYPQERAISTLANQQLLSTLQNAQDQSNDEVKQAQNNSDGSYGKNISLPELLLNWMNKPSTTSMPADTDKDENENTKYQNGLQDKLQKFIDLEQRIMSDMKKDGNQKRSNKPASHSDLISIETEQQRKQKVVTTPSTKSKEAPESSKKTVQHKSYNFNSSLTSLDEELDPSTSTNTRTGNIFNQSQSLNTQLENLTLEGKENERSGKFKDTLTAISLPDLASLGLLETKAQSSKGTNDEDDERQDRGTSKSVPGVYSQPERMLKILRYKKKIMKWRINHPLNRNFSGRSQVAGSKPRIKGKFVTKEEYQKYMEKHKPNNDNQKVETESIGQRISKKEI